MDTRHETTTIPASRLEQVRTKDVVVLRPVGTLDDTLADDIRERALEARAPIVIDLDGCLHLEGSAVQRIASSWTLYRPEMCFACSSVGDRRMLEGFQSDGALAVFASVDQAMAVRGGVAGGWGTPDAALRPTA